MWKKAFKNVNCCANVSIFITLPFPEPERLKSEKKKNGSTMSIVTFNSSPKTGCRKNITLLWKQMLLYIKFKTDFFF